jgi:hypothetical protein
VSNKPLLFRTQNFEGFISIYSIQGLANFNM